MPKSGPAYPIDQKWRERVTARIAELGISQNELGRRAKISKASLSELLDPASKQSAFVPKIHKALGWPEPPPLLLSSDTQELMSLYEGMSERDKGAMLERARVIAEQNRKR